MAHPSGWDIKYTYSLYYSRRENPHHPLWFFSLAFNFEVTSLGCVRRGPALLYMGVVSLSTGGLVGRGGGAPPRIHHVTVKGRMRGKGPVP